MKKYIVALVLTVGIIGSAAPLAYADTASSTPSHIKGSASPYYFFHELGIQTTFEAAAAVWQMGRVRQAVMSLWRHQVFGADVPSDDLVPVTNW